MIKMINKIKEFIGEDMWSVKGFLWVFYLLMSGYAHYHYQQALNSFWIDMLTITLFASPVYYLCYLAYKIKPTEKQKYIDKN